MIPIGNPILLAKLAGTAILAIGLLATGWHYGAQGVQRAWDADTARRDAEQSAAAIAHAQAIAKRDAATADLKDTLERQHHADTAKITRALADARRATAAAGGLRDPGARADCPAVPDAADTPGERDHGTAGARLSPEAGEFLLALAAEADAVVAQLDRCRAWALGQAAADK